MINIRGYVAGIGHCRSITRHLRRRLWYWLMRQYVVTVHCLTAISHMIIMRVIVLLRYVSRHVGYSMMATTLSHATWHMLRLLLAPESYVEYAIGSPGYCYGMLNVVNIYRLLLRAGYVIAGSEYITALAWSPRSLARPLSLMHRTRLHRHYHCSSSPARHTTRHRQCSVSQ